MHSRFSISPQYVVVVLGIILALVVILIGTGMEGHNKAPVAVSKPFLVAPILKLQNPPATVPTILDVIGKHHVGNDSLGMSKPEPDTTMRSVTPMR